MVWTARLAHEAEPSCLRHCTAVLVRALGSIACARAVRVVCSDTSPGTSRVGISNITSTNHF
eukprot:scaffold7671_cov104-Isochrysis_galbana.AAC.3